jgi:hypothetical protein
LSSIFILTCGLYYFFSVSSFIILIFLLLFFCLCPFFLPSFIFFIRH